MKLTYRGIAYEKPILSLEITDGEILGKYRGVSWQARHLKEPCVSLRSFSSFVARKYRGRAYFPGFCHQKAPFKAKSPLFD
jgi:hypothetical protein